MARDRTVTGSHVLSSFLSNSRVSAPFTLSIHVRLDILGPEYIIWFPDLDLDEVTLEFAPLPALSAPQSFLIGHKIRMESPSSGVTCGVVRGLQTLPTPTITRGHARGLSTLCDGTCLCGPSCLILMLRRACPPLAL